MEVADTLYCTLKNRIPLDLCSVKREQGKRRKENVGTGRLALVTVPSVAVS